MANLFTAGAANREAAADFLENPEFMRDTYRGVTLHEHTGVNIPSKVPANIPFILLSVPLPNKP